MSVSVGLHNYQYAVIVICSYAPCSGMGLMKECLLIN